MNEQRIEEARAHHSRGDLARAISTYDEVLAANPDLADVWHLKALAEHQSGRLGEAQASVARAIAAGGEKPSFLLLEAGVLHDRHDLAAAEDRFAKVVAARPDWVAGHMGLGSVRMDQGRAAEAIESFRAAVTVDATHIRGWNNLGMAFLVLNRIEEAMRAFNYALSLDAGYAMAHFNLARIYKLRADDKHALEHAQAAVRSDPAHTEAWLLVGDIQRRRRDANGAFQAYRAAINSAPGLIKARIALAELLAETGHREDARLQYRAISEADPANLMAALGANLVLPQIYASNEHLEESRREYALGLERLHEAAPRFRFATAEAALKDIRWANFYLAYQGRNDLELQKRFGEFQRSVLEKPAAEFFQPRRARSGGDRIRVGFASHFFFNCTVGRYFASWVKSLDTARFETFVYYTNDWLADDTKAIAAAAGAFRHLPGRPIATTAQHIAADALDILVYPEIGMHHDTVALAGLRLAPVQCSGWGHPDTTGLTEMDWFISCAEMEPAGAEAHYSEKLALLPGLGTRYGIPQMGAPGTRADFGIPADRTIYLVPQSLFKIHPDNDDLIAQVLERDPNGVALLFASQYDVVTQAFAARLSETLKSRDLDFYERVCFSRGNVQHADYLRINTLCDVMLDTLHWSGGNTTLDALASGLPVITLPGDLMRGRQSQAMLKMLGLDELIAPDVESYVEKAVSLGRDRERRTSISQRIVSNRPALYDRDEPIRALESFFERALRDPP
jgi:predicted O-linked N-acetylglucosamine transferase (SPINDLY family)